MELKSTGLREVLASLEGMKIVALENQCELHEFNFEQNCWQPLETHVRPMPERAAEEWLRGWNHVDRFEALMLLTHAADDWR
jgi:hypothetical protein